jgi:hypothetical protein
LGWLCIVVIAYTVYVRYGASFSVLTLPIVNLQKPRTPYEGKYKGDIVAVLHSTIISYKNPPNILLVNTPNLKEEKSANLT